MSIKKIWKIVFHEVVFIIETLAIREHKHIHQVINYS